MDSFPGPNDSAGPENLLADFLLALVVGIILMPVWRILCEVGAVTPLEARTCAETDMRQVLIATTLIAFPFLLFTKWVVGQRDKKAISKNGVLFAFAAAAALAWVVLFSSSTVERMLFLVVSVVFVALYIRDQRSLWERGRRYGQEADKPNIYTDWGHYATGSDFVDGFRHGFGEAHPDMPMVEINIYDRGWNMGIPFMRRWSPPKPDDERPKPVGDDGYHL